MLISCFLMCLRPVEYECCLHPLCSVIGLWEEEKKGVCRKVKADLARLARTIFRSVDNRKKESLFASGFLQQSGVGFLSSTELGKVQQSPRLGQNRKTAGRWQVVPRHASVTLTTCWQRGLWCGTYLRIFYACKSTIYRHHYILTNRQKESKTKCNAAEDF